MSKNLWKRLWVCLCLFSLLGGVSSTAYARSTKTKSDFWKRVWAKEKTRWLSVSFGGGMNVYKGQYYDEFGTFEDTAMTHGIVSATAHFWVLKDLAIDLGLDGHFITDYDTGEGWLQGSIRPGVRMTFFYLFYVVGGLDFLIGRPKHAFVFGVYLGAGIRIPVSERLRLFGEFNVNFYPGLGHAPPIHGKLGFEVVF